MRLNVSPNPIVKRNSAKKKKILIRIAYVLTSTLLLYFGRVALKENWNDYSLHIERILKQIVKKQL
jgi:hypothetical protein